MPTVKVVQTGEAKTRLKRITLLEEDGSETVINVSDNVHYIVAFVNTDPALKEGFPAEIMVGGEIDNVGELFFQLGNIHPDLIKHCVRRSTEKIANTVLAEIKRSGVDPIGEALKKMEPGEKARWN